MKCIMISHAVHDGPHGMTFGGSRCVTFCQTHNVQVANPIVDQLCAIGKIEEATDIALAKIKAAQS